MPPGSPKPHVVLEHAAGPSARDQHESGVENADKRMLSSAASSRLIVGLHHVLVKIQAEVLLARQYTGQGCELPFPRCSARNRPSPMRL